MSGVSKLHFADGKSSFSSSACRLAAPVSLRFRFHHSLKTAIWLKSFGRGLRNSLGALQRYPPPPMACRRSDGFVLDVLVQSRRNTKAAKAADAKVPEKGKAARRA
ncbi:hypothetical protein AJ87_47060 [Rhizobium yanglingense]|nr:hypothetical protein AJ87_47060 [Rhizobium yanglingense]